MTAEEREEPYVGQLIKHTLIRTYIYVDEDDNELSRPLVRSKTSCALIIKLNELMGDAGSYSLAEIRWDDGEQGFIRPENFRETRTSLKTIATESCLDVYHSITKPQETVATKIIVEEIIELL